MQILQNYSVQLIGIINYAYDNNKYLIEKSCNVFMKFIKFNSTSEENKVDPKRTKKAKNERNVELVYYCCP